MKPGVPWSIKGVEPELREAAKFAARRSGMTLGEWLNSAINDQADSAFEMPDISPRSRPQPRSRHETSHPIERAASKLEDIADKLARLQPGETSASYRGNAQVEQQGNFAKILARVESHERKTGENFNAINGRLDTISTQITRHQPQKFEETPSYQALDKAVRNIIEHLEVSDKRTRENMKVLQERIGDMSSRFGTSQSDQFLRQAPAFSALESRLTELASKFDRQPNQTPGDQLRSEIEQLAHRIDTVRDSSEQLANRAQTAAVQTAQQELRAIEGRLINLLNEAKQSIMTNHVGPAELQRFRGEIDKLHARIDEAQRNAASDRDVSALKVAIEQLSNRVNQSNDQKPIADLDRRILEIAQKLERAEQQGYGQTMMSEVERRFAELDQRLSSPQDTRWREMDDRLARTEQQLSHLETIERAIAQLYEAFEEDRKKPQAAGVAPAAEGAATDQPVAAGALANAPEIVALENGLKAVRAAAEGADQRNQETLEAVHETLEQIVSKLAELETAAIGQRVGAAIAPVQIDNPFEPKEEEQGRNPFATEDAPAPKLEGLHIPEPPVTQPAPAANPFGDVSEPAMEAAAPAAVQPAKPVEAGIAEMIAAARRSHQANAAQPGQLSSFAPGKAKLKVKGEGKGLNLPFLGGMASKLRPTTGQKAANNNAETGGKRRLVIMGFALLIIASFGISNFVSRSYQASHAPTAASSEQTVAPLASPSVTPAPQAATPSLAAPDTSANKGITAGQVPPLPEPAPLANPGQQSSADDILTTDPITTGAISPAGKAGADLSALDPSVGPSKLRDAASNGDNTAQFIIATHYLNGDTTAQDYAKAAFWYGKAASAGLAPAQYRLATLYERGTGVQKNMTTALKWYEAAGTMGNIKAMHNAAVIAAGNEAGGPDYNKAYKWFSLAAAHGLKDSEFNLAVLMERGLGVKQDNSEALFWYMAAAQQDDGDAKARVASLSKSLTPASVDAVTKRFKAWVPEKAPDNANVVAVNDAQWNPGAAKAPANVQGNADNPNDNAKKLLDKLGYRVGELDGTLDAKTANAIKLYQIREGMKATGKVTPDLLEKMQASAG